MTFTIEFKVHFAAQAQNEFYSSGGNRLHTLCDTSFVHYDVAKTVEQVYFTEAAAFPN